MPHSLSNFDPLHNTYWDVSALVKAFEDATGAGAVIFASLNDAANFVDVVGEDHADLMLVASHPDVVHHLTSAEFVEGLVNSPVPIEVGHQSLGVRIFIRESVVWNEIGDAIVIRSSNKSIADQVIVLDDLSARIEGEVVE